MHCLSDGEAGASIGFLRAAKKHGFNTTGVAPYNYKTADGINPDLRSVYGLSAVSSPCYKPFDSMKSCYNALYVWIGPKTNPRYKSFVKGLSNPLNGVRDVYVLSPKNPSEQLLNLILHYNPYYLMVTGPTGGKNTDLTVYNICDTTFTMLEKMQTAVKTRDKMIFDHYFKALRYVNAFVDSN